MKTLRELIEQATPDAKKPRSFSDAAREEVAARCSPETMRMVLEALESCSTVETRDGWLDHQSHDEYSVQKALKALNGGTQP